QKLTNVNSIAPQMLTPHVRNILPNTTIDTSTLLSGDLTKLGSLGMLASQIQSRYTIAPSSSSSADAAYAQALKDSTGRAATMAALGQNTLSVSQTRMQGLDQLREELSSAKDPKDVMDLQARISVEQAQLQNDMLKMQAIQMAQAGQASLSLTATQTAAARDADASFASAILRK
ncbi:MAG: type VI secretion protein, partial [Oxalobacteraceae bacterium]